VETILAALAGGGLALCWLLMAIYFWREKSVIGSFFLIVLASTDFRLSGRDPTEALAGAVDAQVLFELVAYAIVGVNCAWLLLSQRLDKTRLTLNELGLLLYASLAISSLLWSAVPLYSLVRSCQLAVLALLAYTAVRVLSPKEAMKALGKAVVISVVLFAVLGVLFPHTESDRFGWLSQTPGGAAVFLGLAVVFLASDALDPAYQAQGRRLLVWLLSMFCFLVVMATQTRSVVAAVPIVLTVVLVVRYLSTRTVRLAATSVVTFAVLAILAVALFPYGLADVVESLARSNSAISQYVMREQSTYEFTGLSGRIELWAVVWDLFLARPLFGYGYLASRSVLAEAVPWAGYAHNALGQSLLDFGLLGSTVLWFTMFRTLYLTRPTNTNKLDPEGSQVRITVLGVVLFLFGMGIFGASFAGEPSIFVLVAYLSATTVEKVYGSGEIAFSG